MTKIRISRENGAACQPIAVYLSPGANALETAQLVREKMDELSKFFPEGVSYTLNSARIIIVRDTTLLRHCYRCSHQMEKSAV